MTRTPFEYVTASSSKQPYLGGHYFESTMPYDSIATSGVAPLLCGVHENLRIGDPDEDPEIAFPLVIEAPSEELYPMTTGPVNEGKVAGVGYKWRARYKNSSTGEVSGLSPSPREGITLGSEEGANYVGETAYLQFPSTNGSKPGVDYIQLFRNTAQQEDVYYLVEEKPFDGSAAVTFVDNTTDEELFNKETHLVSPNPGYLVGIPWACARVYSHPNGETWYYGILRRGRFWRTGQTVVATKGENHLAGADPGYGFSGNREFLGMRWRPLTDQSDAAITDPQDYRIVAIDTATQDFVVSPAPEQDMAVKSYEVVDDRNARVVYKSEANRPTSFDPLKMFLEFGRDLDDGVQHIFALGTQTHVATRRRIFRLTDDNSEATEETYRVTEAIPEGVAGFYAGAVTPFGYVFVNELGVRVFDGSSVRALGNPTLFGPFLPKTQFASAERDAMAFVQVGWDKDAYLLHVSFAPTDAMSLERDFVFDPEFGVWRGPHRRRVYRVGRLRNADGEDVFLLGDDTGNLVLDDDQTLDVVPTITSHTLSGTISNVAKGVSGNGLTFTAQALATFDPESDLRLIGCPIVFDDGSGNTYVNWILDIPSARELTLVNIPSPELQTGWTFKIGAVDWTAESTYIDNGDPFHKKKAQKLLMRKVLDTTDAFTVQVSADDGTYQDDEQATHAAGKVFVGSRVEKGGHTFRFKLSGTATNGEPTITEAVLEMDQRAGYGQ